MLKQLRYVVTAAFVVSVTMVSTVTAQGTLGFTIDPTQGLPGDTVAGQVNPADISANCNTTAAQVQDAFKPIAFFDFDTGLPSGRLLDPDFIIMYYPSGEIGEPQNYDQLAYAAIGTISIGISRCPTSRRRRFPRRSS